MLCPQKGTGATGTTGTALLIGVIIVIRILLLKKQGCVDWYCIYVCDNGDKGKRKDMRRADVLLYSKDQGKIGGRIYK